MPSGSESRGLGCPRHKEAADAPVGQHPLLLPCFPLLWGLAAPFALAKAPSRACPGTKKLHGGVWPWMYLDRKQWTGLAENQVHGSLVAS